MIELNKIATNLQPGEHEIWFSKKRSHISYPEDGNLRCLTVEDSSFWFKHRNKCIIESMRLFPPEGAVYDVGAGNGYVTLAIKNAGFDAVVIEPGIQGAMNARNRGLSPVICSTLEDAGFKDHLIPAVGLFDLLEHIKDDISFLKTVKDLLIPGGRLYITVPAYSFLWSVEDDHAGHYRRYTTKSLSIALKSIGFKIEFSTYIFGLLPIPIFIFRSIPSKLGFRSKRDSKRPQKEHCHNKSLLGSLLNCALDKELRALRNNRTIPVGGSCLIVATSK
jgi:SAM-dependent methyltransferase